MVDRELQEIRRHFNELRGRLPAADEVRVRTNRRRALSITRPRGRVRLNVARAVVEAGPDAWRLIGPTLRKDPDAHRRFRELVAPRMAAASAHPAGGESAPPRSAGTLSGKPTRVRRPGRTRPTPCQGTAHERWVMATLWGWAEARFQPEIPFPSPTRLRISRRMRRSYGNAGWKGDRYELTLGRQLFRAGLEPILLDTFLHELAHLVDLAHRGRTDHGPHWRRWAQRLGANPTRLLPLQQVKRVAAARHHPVDLPEPVRSWWEASGSSTLPVAG